MTELERARRLPVFIDEEQWSRAYEAAMQQVETLYSQGVIDVPHGRVNGTLKSVAVQIATAALRAAAQDDEGDLGDLPGVKVAQIPDSIVKSGDPWWRPGDGGVDPDEYFSG